MAKNTLNSYVKTIHDKVNDGLFALCEGMMFDGATSTDCWIYGRGYSYGALIEQPAYNIESINRDWIWRETITGNYTSASNSLVITNGSATNDYYNGAYIFTTKGTNSAKITDYVGSTRTATISGSLGTSTTGGKYIITNITKNSTRLISTSSFDSIGNSSSGKRAGWKFRKVIDAKINANALLKELLFESWLFMHKEYNSYKLYALGIGTSAGTFSKPIYAEGKPQITWEYTPLTDIYSSFKIGYNYDYSTQSPRSYIEVDRYSTTDSTNLGTSYMDKCETAGFIHAVNNTFSYDCSWISDYTTAYKFAQRCIDWFTQRKMIVRYRGDIKNHIAYEHGDQVLINFADVIPTGKNNSTKFMIVGKSINADLFNPYIEFTLMEMV